MDAAANAALGAASLVDLMRMGDRFAASVATAGFSVSVNARANTMRFPRGASKYTVATLRELRNMGARDIDLTIDGETHKCRSTVVTVANTSDFGGGMRISPAAKPDDGLLEVTVVGECGRLELLRWFRKVFDGSHLDHPRVSTFQGSAITLEGEVGDVWADGEPVSTAEVTIEVVPKALHVAGL
jgi:diacylglycerol kinase (ATP)